MCVSKCLVALKSLVVDIPPPYYVPQAKEWEKERRTHREELKVASQSKHANDKSASKLLDLEEQLRVARDNEVDALEQLSSDTNELKSKIAELEEQLDVANKEVTAAASKGDGDVVLRLKHELSKATKSAEKFKGLAQQAAEQQQQTARDAQIRIEAAEAKNEILTDARTEKEAGSSRELMLQESRLTELSSLVGRYEVSRYRLQVFFLLSRLGLPAPFFLSQTHGFSTRDFGPAHAADALRAIVGLTCFALCTICFSHLFFLSLISILQAARLTDSNELQGLREENSELLERLQAVDDSGQESESGGNASGADAGGRIAMLEQEVGRLQKRLQSAQLANQRRLADYDLDEEGMVDVTAAVAPPWHGIVLHGEQVPPQDVQEARDVADSLYEKISESQAAKKECAATLKKTLEAYRSTAERLDKVIQEHSAEAAAEKEGFRFKLEAMDNEYRTKEATAETDHGNIVRRMTKRAQKVRERTLELLEERDVEIARLRGKEAGTNSPGGSPSKPKPKRVRSASRVLPPALNGGGGDGAGAAGAAGSAAGVMATPKSDGMGTGGKLIYNALEAHERGREMSTARQQLRDLEIALDDATFKEELLADQNEALKNEIRRLDSNAAREGANLEYLKNVFVKYMTEDTGKEQSFLAISTILQFSRKEMAAIKPRAVPTTGITSWFGGSAK